MSICQNNKRLQDADISRREKKSHSEKSSKTPSANEQVAILQKVPSALFSLGNNIELLVFCERCVNVKKGTCSGIVLFYFSTLRSIAGYVTLDILFSEQMGL